MLNIKKNFNNFLLSSILFSSGIKNDDVAASFNTIEVIRNGYRRFVKKPDGEKHN